jgi:Holliday junction resolvase RusA-like endonuclease
MIQLPPRYFALHLNPEPWAIGDVWAGRKDGRIQGRISPNPNLQAFQNAVREELASSNHQLINLDRYRLTFYFWRQQARYIDMADHVRQRNQADATNLQKGLEDALQGVLFANDRDVRDIRSVIVEQSPHVKNPRILIAAEPLKDPVLELLRNLPPDLSEDVFIGKRKEQTSTDKWQDADDLF